jgi:hypothetical protein
LLYVRQQRVGDSSGDALAEFPETFAGYVSCNVFAWKALTWNSDHENCQLHPTLLQFEDFGW